MAIKRRINIRRIFRINTKSDGFIFLICLLIATVFWFLKTLEQSYITTVKLPVKVINLPNDKILKRPLPENLFVNVKAPGWDILGIKMGTDVLHITIDFNEVTNAEIITDRRSALIKNQLPSSFDVLDVFPDTIHIEFDELAEKTVKVTLNADLFYKTQHNLSGPVKFEPEKVKVVGPETVIRNINEVSTKKLVLKNLEEIVQRTVPLVDPPQENIKYEPDKVKIWVPVEKLTEGNVEIPIEIINRSFSYKIDLIPHRVKIVYQTALSNYESIKPEDFKVVVDGKNLKPGGENELKVNLIEHPDFIYSVRVVPEYVDYIITNY